MTNKRIYKVNINFKADLIVEQENKKLLALK